MLMVIHLNEVATDLKDSQVDYKMKGSAALVGKALPLGAMQRGGGRVLGRGIGSGCISQL